MKRRLSRAKLVLRKEGVRFEMPSRPELDRRLDSVLHAVYLLYNEGLSSDRGSTDAVEFTREGLFLARELSRLMPEPEVLGLLALLLFHESRRPARNDAQGELVALEDQDRAMWDRDLIAEGLSILQRVIRSGRIGPYGVQAAIASVHAVATSTQTTNWDLILHYYDTLAKIQDTAVVRLNRGIALGMKDGPESGLAAITLEIDSGDLDSYAPAFAAQAEFNWRLGRTDSAVASIRQALALAEPGPVHRYLERRLGVYSRTHSSD